MCYLCVISFDRVVVKLLDTYRNYIAAGVFALIADKTPRTIKESPIHIQNLSFFTGSVIRALPFRYLFIMRPRLRDHLVARLRLVDPDPK